MDGLIYAMEGSGQQWQFRKTIAGTGQKKFSIAAKNIYSVTIDRWRTARA